MKLEKTQSVEPRRFIKSSRCRESLIETLLNGRLYSLTLQNISFFKCEIAQGLIDFCCQDAFIQRQLFNIWIVLNKSISIYSKVHYAHFEHFIWLKNISNARHSSVSLARNECNTSSQFFGHLLADWWNSRTDLPKVSYATSLDWFILMTFAYCIASLIQFAAVHYFTKVRTFNSTRNFLWFVP